MFALNRALWFSGCVLTFEQVRVGFESRHVLLLFALILKIQFDPQKSPMGIQVFFICNIHIFSNNSTLKENFFRGGRLIGSLVSAEF